MVWKKAVLPIMLCLFAGCSFRAPHVIVPDYAKTTRLVALMPVENKTSDGVAAQMLREKMLEELYFKGYPKIPLDLIDRQFSKLGGGDAKAPQGNVSPQSMGELLKVDAVMYCTLSASETPIYILYAPTSLAMSCELRSAKTGEMLWKSRCDIRERNFGYSRLDVERKAAKVYEAAIQEAVHKVLETLPDGPDLTG